MDKRTTTYAVVLILVLGGVIAGILYVAKQPVQVSTVSEKKTIDITATERLSTSAEKADVYLTVETESITALASQQENAERMEAIVDALADEGVEKNETETTYYNLRAVRVYDEKTGNWTIKGYVTTHTLKVELKEINTTGKIIDAAVNAGANRIDSINFDITDETMEKLKADALSLAAKNAKEKADAMAADLGVKVVGVFHANEQTVYTPRPYYVPKVIEAAAATEIIPGQIEVSATIAVTYEIA